MNWCPTPRRCARRRWPGSPRIPQAQQPWDDKNYKMPGGTPSNPKIAGMLSVAPAVLKQKTRGLYPAPEYALAAMVEGAQVDFDTALRIESRYLARLIVEPGGEEHDQHVLLQHERDQVRAVAAARTCRATSRRRSASWAPA